MAGRILHTARRRQAFSLMEVLVLVVVLGIVAASAGRALQAVARTPVTTDEVFQIETQMISKMEELRCSAFDALLVGTTNNTISIGDLNIPGAAKYHQMTVTIELGDPDANGITDATFKQLTVSVAGQSITTLVAR
jgi:hypothetical protein